MENYYSRLSRALSRRNEGYRPAGGGGGGTNFPVGGSPYGQYRPFGQPAPVATPTPQEKKAVGGRSAVDGSYGMELDPRTKQGFKPGGGVKDLKGFAGGGFVRDPKTGQILNKPRPKR